MTRLFDNYGRKARLYPALLSVFPPLVTVLAWFPLLLTTNLGVTLLTLGMSCGVLYAMAMFSRSRGKAAERRLLAIWGTWPTTEWLRHSDPHLTPQTRARYHKFLRENVPALKLPDAEDQARDPVKADASYHSAVEWLRENSRNMGYAILEKENAEYGFRRNLYGMKPVAMGAASLALLSTITAVYLVYGTSFVGLGGLRKTPVELAAVAFVDFTAVLAWLFFVTPAWVREAGDQYARALLATCDAPAKK